MSENRSYCENMFCIDGNEAIEEAISAYRRGRVRDAMAKLEGLAAAGDAQASFNLGIAHSHGHWLPVDPVKAADYFRQGAERGSVLAAFNLARCYEKGVGLARDDKEAARWYLESAKLGNYHAGHDLAALYLEGRGVEEDKIEAFAWFYPGAHASIMDEDSLRNCIELARQLTRPQVEDGQARGRNYLDRYILPNRLVVEAIADPAKRMKGTWSTVADQSREAVAETRGQTDGGAPVPTNDKATSSAIPVVREPAGAPEVSGPAMACSNVFGIVADPNTIEGIAAYRRGAMEEAVAKLEAGAAAGDGQAYFNLGIMHAAGHGTPVDLARAAEYYRQGAERGSVLAAYQIAQCYKKGTGVAQDYEAAARWYLYSATRGNYRAGNQLAILYIEGKGVKRDLIEALAWFYPATHEAIKDEGCLQNAIRLAGMLTPKQLHQAQERGRSYFERYMAPNMPVVEAIMAAE